MGRDVFVSHSSVDKATADAVVAALESSGITCWIAPRDIAPGTSYMSSIAAALESAPLVVLVFSASADQSTHVRREVQHAVELGREVIPLRLDGAKATGSLAYALAGTHWVDAASSNLEHALAVLPVAAQALLPSRESSPTVPTVAAPPDGPVRAPSGRGARAARVPVSGDQDVVVVAARSAYPLYLRHGVYICQAGRAFRSGVGRIAFYSDGQIQPQLAGIRLIVDNVRFDEQGLARLEDEQGDLGAELASRLQRVLDEDPRRHGTSDQVFLLTGPDDPETLRLPRAIPNDLRTHAGRPTAYTMGQRYVATEALRRVGEAGLATSSL